jgi:hypothetical protein
MDDRLPPAGLLASAAKLAVDRAVAAALLGARESVVTACLERELPLEPAVALEAVESERTGLERFADRTARLTLVCTIGEAAARREALDVVECLGQAILRVPEREYAHSRGIQEQASSREREEPPARGRVPPATIRADLPNGL